MEQRWYLCNGIQLGFDWLDLVGQLLVELSSWIMDNEVKTWIPPWQHVVDSAVVPECRVVNCCHLTLCLARLLFLKKREYNNSFTPQRWGVCSVLKTPWKEEGKNTVPTKDECEKVRRRGQYCFSKDILEVVSASQDVSLFTSWRNYSRHKCSKQNAKITWRTNATRDWQEK